MTVKFFVDMGREREANEKGRRGRKGSKDHKLRRERIKLGQGAWGRNLSPSLLEQLLRSEAPFILTGQW